MKNQKVLAGIMAAAMLCANVPVYGIAAAPAVITASAAEEDVASFLGSYTESDGNAAYYTGASETIPIAGRSYLQGIVLSNYSGYTSSITYDVSSVSSLGFTAGHVDGKGAGDGKLTIYLDGLASDTYDLTARMSWKDITVDTSAASSVKLEIAFSGGTGAYALADVKIDGSGADTPYITPSYTAPEGLLKSGYDADSTTVYTAADQSAPFHLAGRSYYQGVVFDDYSGYSDSVSYNVETVNTLDFTLAHVDNSGSGSATISFYLDGLKTETAELNQYTKWQPMSLDVSGASILRIEVEHHDGSAGYAVANLTLDGTAPAIDYTVPNYKTPEAFLKGAWGDDSTEFYTGSDQSASFQLAGRTYFQGLTFKDYSGYSDTVCYNVENVDSLSFTLGHVDDSGLGNATMTFYLDGMEAEKYDLTPHMLNKEYTLDTSSASVLRIVTEHSGGYAAYAAANFSMNGTAPELSPITPSYSSAEAMLKAGYNASGNAKVFASNDTASNFVMNGQTYLQGVTFQNYSGYSDQITFNVEKVGSLSFEYGHLDDAGTGTGTLSIYLDGLLADTIDLANAGESTAYTLDTASASTLRLEMKISGSSSGFGLANFTAAEGEAPQQPTDPGKTDPTPSGDDGLFGDINGDGAIDSTDAALLLEFAAYDGAHGGGTSLKEYLAIREQG